MPAELAWKVFMSGKRFKKIPVPHELSPRDFLSLFYLKFTDDFFGHFHHEVGRYDGYDCIGEVH